MQSPWLPSDLRKVPTGWRSYVQGSPWPQRQLQLQDEDQNQENCRSRDPLESQGFSIREAWRRFQSKNDEISNPQSGKTIKKGKSVILSRKHFN